MQAQLAAQTQPAADTGQISGYWDPRVQQWSALIVREAQRRNLDPDFLAALVWMESLGDAQSIGESGSVGLMQVMPKEAGFNWRPTRAELLDPATNLFWGTRTLATVIHQGKGDIFNALAAYNGGWEQTTYRGPRYYATTILREYAASQAWRYGVQGRWIGFFAVVEDSMVRGPIWVADSGREDVYFFGKTNRLPDGALLIPDALLPTALAVSCLDEERGVPYQVGLWLYQVAEGAWYFVDEAYDPAQVTAVTPSPTLTETASPTPAATATPSATLTAAVSPTPVITPTARATATPSATPTTATSPTPVATPTSRATATPTAQPSPTAAASPTPVATPTTTPTARATATPASAARTDAVVAVADAELRPGATRWWWPECALEKGAAVTLVGYDPAYPDWVFVRTPDRKEGWIETAHLTFTRDVTRLPLITPMPTPSPTLTPSAAPATATPLPTALQPACESGDFWAEAWPGERVNTPEGWKATIFARGHAGTCSYTYAWNVPEDVRGGPMAGPLIFDVVSPHRHSAIAGSVIVTSGHQSVTVRLYINPPED